METESSSTQTSLLSEQTIGASAPVKAVMVFRFWIPTSGGTESKPAEHDPAHDPGMLALIEDVVASRRGILLTTHDQQFVSVLKDPADALVVSRQVQLGLQGFRGKHGPGSVSVSIAMDANAGVFPTRAEPEPEDGPKDAEPSVAVTADGVPEPPHDLLTLLKLSKPAQILVTHDLYRQVAGIKGLPLKSFPGRFGVYEYLWTTEDKLEVLQSEPQLTLAAIPSSTTASGSKPIKDSPIQAVSADPALNSDPPEQINLGAGQIWQNAFSSPRPIFFASLALAAVVAVAVIGIRMAHVSHSQPEKTIAPVSFPTTPVPATNQQTSSPTELGSSGPKRSSQQTTGRQGVTHKSTPIVKPLPVQNSTSTADCSLSGDYPRYVGLAEQYRGRGDYEHAERLFRQVLSCDPSNSAAREGLSRTVQGEQQSRGKP